MVERDYPGRDMHIRYAMRWLEAKHCTLWMNWDLTQPESLLEAATFVVDMTAEFDTYLAREIFAKNINPGTRAFDVVG